MDDENKGLRSKNWLAIGELAARTGLAVSAIRYYEAEGLIAAIRTSGNQRRFPRAEIRRLSFITIAQRLGFTLEEIKSALESLPNGRTPTKRDWNRLSKSFRKRLDERIAALELLRERLDGCIGCGCLSLKSCSLYNPGDDIAKKGAGPRYLLGDHPKRI